MATLQVTIPDAAVPRIQAAFGGEVLNDPNNPQGGTHHVNATVSDVMTAIKGFIKSKVVDYETTQAAITDRASRSADVGTW